MAQDVSPTGPDRTGGDRSISIGHDAVGNIVILGDGNSVTLIVADQRLLARRSSAAAAGTPVDNPYRGLDAFYETHAAWFFGRTRLVRRAWVLFQNLQRGTSPRILAVVGASGSGKSSLVRAGLLTELARQPMAGLGSPQVLVVRPGAAPLQRLAEVLARLLGPGTDIEAALARRGSAGSFDALHRLIAARAQAQRSPLVVVVDQFEELYTEGSNAETRTAFLENLAFAAAHPDRLVSVILTLRGDFAVAVQEPAAFVDAVRTNRLTVQAMGRDELREAIERPADALGHSWPPALVENLIAQAEGRAGALPLLQFALKKLWPQHAAGGLEEAAWSSHLIEDFLVETAEALYENAGAAPEQGEINRRIIRRAFIDMILFGEGTADTRRVSHIADLVAHGETAEQVGAVLAPFTAPEARLVSASAQDGSTTYELTHEALIASWSRLRAWLGNVPDKGESEKIRTRLRLQRRLAAAAREWKSGVSGPWGSVELAQLQGSAASDDGGLTDLQRAFIASSERQVRRQWWMTRGAVAAIAGLALAALIFAERSDRNATVAQANEIRAKENEARARTNEALAETNASWAKDNEKLARESEARAIASAAQAKENLARAGEQLAQRLIVRGRQLLSERPELSVRYAEMSSRLNTDVAAAGLLQAAAEALPVWRRLPDPHAHSDAPSPSVSSARSSDIFAADPDLELLIAGVPKTAPPAPSDTSVIGLYSIATGELLEQRPLRQEERFATPDPSPSNLFATRSTPLDPSLKSAGPVDDGPDVDIFELSRGGLAKPALSLKAVRSFAYSGGNWPLFALAQNGDLTAYVKTQGSIRPRRLERFADSQRLEASAKGDAVLVFDSFSVAIVTDPLSEKKRRDIDLTSLGGCVGVGPDRLQVLWAPVKGAALLACSEGAAVGSEKSGLYYVHPGSPAPLKISDFPPGSYASSDGPLVALSDDRTLLVINGGRDPMGSDGGIPAVLLRLDWTGVEKTGGPKVVERVALQGERAPYSMTSPQSKAIDPKARYVVFSRFHGSETRRQALELWTVGNLKPPVTLRIGTGTAIRLVPSRDGRRMLALDDRRIVHVFNIGDFLDANWRRRFAPAVTQDESGEHVHVDYGGWDVRHYRASSGVETVLVPEQHRHDTVAWHHTAERGETIIVTRQAAIRRKVGEPDRVIRLPFRVSRVHRGESILTLFSDRDMHVLDLQRFALENVVPAQPAEFKAFLRQWRADHAIRSFSWQPIEAGGHAACFLFASGLRPQTSSEWIWRSFDCWKLTRVDRGAGFRAERTLTQALRDDAGYTVMALPGKNMAFLAHFKGDSVRQELEQYNYATGKRQETFQLPEGWPISYRSFEHVSVVNGKVVLFFHSGGDRPGLGYCVYEAAGGPCPEPRVISPEGYAEVRSVRPGQNGGIGHAMIVAGVFEPKAAARLVNLADGTTVFESADWAPLLPRPAMDGEGHWTIGNKANYEKIRQTIALGGRIFDRFTVVPLPLAEQRSLQPFIPEQAAK